MTTNTQFDPARHLTLVSGKEYLEVIPEGWTLISIRIHEVQPATFEYVAHLITDLGDDVTGMDPDPWQALLKAIADPEVGK